LIKDIIYQADTAPTNGGDWIIEESEQQHIGDIIISNKGEWRQFPLLGVAGHNFLTSTLDIDDIRKKISRQLEYDNFNVEEISLLDTGEIRTVARQNEES
jgi:hypothetical protein